MKRQEEIQQEGIVERKEVDQLVIPRLSMVVGSAQPLMALGSHLPRQFQSFSRGANLLFCHQDHIDAKDGA